MQGPDPEWSAPLPAGADRWRAIAPAVLLAVIALMGVRNHIVRDQSSWQGAGFGMFATYDNDSSRVVAVSIDGGDGPQRVRLPDSLDDEVLRLKVVPTGDGADALARRVLELVDGPADVQVTVRKVTLSGDDVITLRYEVLASGEAGR
jgi:hypothetical protein